MKKCSTCGTLYAGDLCPKCMAGFAQNPTAATQPPEELPLQPGQTFHGLEIVELLGRGGMGVVYKARQPALDRFVALKILPRRMALDPDFQSRFIREAKALGSLSHPNIVLVHDFGAEGDLFFFVMEFVDGLNLRNLLREKKLDPAQAMRIVPQLCDALEFAHAEGIVHRDIKPENILLDKKGRVKIADFGLAKLTGADTPAHMLTMTNMVMGTPHYMAPEQVENPKSVDHRADIYSMGVVFYEMLTGELPIGRFELPSKKVQIDVRLDEVVLKSLEKAPDRRYQKASDVKEAVTRATSADSYAPTIMTPLPARKGLSLGAKLGIAAVVLLAVVVVGNIVNWARLSSTDHPPLGVTPPPPPKPVSLEKLHFGPDERPLGYRYAPLSEKDKLIDRNPFPAKDADTLGRMAKLLDNIGLQNVSPSDLKEGYAALWWGGTAMVALVSPVSERLETQYAGLKTPMNRWSYRKGELLVLAHTWRREDRQLFNVLVSMVQKKLSLPEQAPDVPLANLMIDKSELPKDWTLGTEPIAETSLAIPCNYHAPFLRPDGQPSLLFHAYLLKSENEAKAAEATLRKSPAAHRHRKAEILRTGRTLAALVLLDDSIGGFEKVAQRIRKNMGYPERTFDTVVPGVPDLPDGYTFDKVVSDPKEAIEAVGLSNVRPEDLRKAFHATLKPHGAVQVFETVESKVRYAVENQLDKIGPSESTDDLVFAVQAPDDVSLDALENRMREKFGYDRNRPRYIKMADARLAEKELPEGWSLKPVRAQDMLYEAHLLGPGGPLGYTARSFNDYRLLEKYAAEEVSASPGDVILIKDFIVVHVHGAEASWPVLDSLVAILRKKMRMGPPTLEDLLHGPGLPDGKVLDESAELRVFATQAKLDPAMIKIAWKLDSDTIQAFILQAKDEKAAESLAKPLAGSFRKGDFVASVRALEGAVAEDVKKLTDQLRGRLRTPKP